MLTIGRHTKLLAAGVLILAALLGLAACEKEPTPPLFLTPTPPPTPTPTVKQVINEQLYSISLNGVLLATERIAVGEADGSVLVASELRRFSNPLEAERRTVVLTEALNPLRYDLERTVLGVRSIWVGERTANGMDCLSNNQNWYAPVLIRQVSPAPNIMLESAPSALPFALLALQYAAAGRETLPRHALDILSDYPVSRSLEVTLSPDRAGAVIGTVALEGRLEGEATPRFTLWVRPNSRVLFRAEIPAHRFGFWDQLAHPEWRDGGKVVIQRVSQLPEIPAPAVAVSDRETAPVSFRGADGSARRGVLALPQGAGPFPCLVIHSPGGVTGRYDPSVALEPHGWAVFAYDKRGVGESEGTLERGPLRALAEDALLAAQALAQRPELDAGRIVFVGLGQGGQVGATALGLQAEQGEHRYAGAVLSGVVAGKLFPDQVQRPIQQALAPFYGWDATQLEAYQRASVQQWRDWLFAGDAEVTLLRRRASLRALRDLNDADLVAAISKSGAPVLLLHGVEDAWTPLEGAQAAARQLESTGRVTLQTFQGLAGDLGGRIGGAAVAPPVEAAIWAWLNAQFPAP